MTLDECARKRAIAGGIIGAIIGAVVGGLLTGPLWPLGVIAGGVLGANAGSLLGVLSCLVRGDGGGGGVSFAKPRFASVRLSANPDPARKNVPCWLSIHYTVVGNTDRALCNITWTIVAEAAVPANSPTYPVANNAETFGRTVDFRTTWPEEHDGRLVTAEIILIATHRGQTYVHRETVPEIRVPVLP